MPSAAPGVTARGALRQINPETSWIPAQLSGRTKEGCSSFQGRETEFRPDERRLHSWFYFTRHLSVFGVECGRLGEVESLVGDCWPPPPGNPRRPLPRRSGSAPGDGLDKNPRIIKHGFFVFIPKWLKNGGVFLPIRKLHTFNIFKYWHNLKEINYSQYFKNKRSYYTCAQKCSVLEFGSFHYHLYGVRLVEPPSIAITNVLVT